MAAPDIARADPTRIPNRTRGKRIVQRMAAARPGTEALAVNPSRDSMISTTSPGGIVTAPTPTDVKNNRNRLRVIPIKTRTEYVYLFQIHPIDEDIRRARSIMV
jgi:hypothetical protein